MIAAPSVSVIVATRDRPALLADALRGVAAQTHAPLEARIGDDGLVAADAGAVPAGLEVVWVRTHGSCAAIPRNAAAEGARGDLLAFLDDDDRWTPEHLARLAAAFRDPGVELAYADCTVVRERVSGSGAREDLERLVLARDWDPEMMRTNDYISPSAIAVRRSRFESLGGFDVSFEFSEDWDFLLRAARHATPRRVAHVTVEVRMRPEGNLSADFGPVRRACLERLAARHGLPALEPRTFWEVAEVMAREDARALARGEGTR